MKKNILIIPHSCVDNIVIRSHEIAKSLSTNHKVYYLEWFRRKDDSYLGKISEVLMNAVQNLTIKKDTDTGIYKIRTKKIYYPYKLALLINEKNISKLIKKYNIDIVINASVFFYSVKKSDEITYIYDVVDDHFRGHAGNFSPAMADKIKTFIEAEMESADYILSVTNSLGDYIEKTFNKHSIWYPNGANIESFHSVSKDLIKTFRNKHTKNGNYIIGYIGNLRDSYTGLSFLLSFFRLAFKKNSNLRLLLVGPTSEEQKKLISKTLGVIYLGHLPPSQMPLIFNSIDLGVLPFEKTPFTEYALPIKIIEYGAAKKHVISTELIGVNEAKMPYVHITERTEQKWVDKLEQVMKLSWQDSYDKRVDDFSWNKVARKIEELF
jgi:teichuronic acid biosynthesis glycosyltransferase TuaH